MRSFQVFTGEVCQVDEDAGLVGAAAEPGEFRRIELRTLAPPISGSIAMPRLKMPIVVPSFGATL